MISSGTRRPRSSSLASRTRWPRKAIGAGDSLLAGVTSGPCGSRGPWSSFLTLLPDYSRVPLCPLVSCHPLHSNRPWFPVLTILALLASLPRSPSHPLLPGPSRSSPQALQPCRPGTSDVPSLSFRSGRSTLAPVSHLPLWSSWSIDPRHSPDPGHPWLAYGSRRSCGSPGSSTSSLS